MNWKRFLGVMFALLAVLSLGSTRVAAQTTVSQGSIQGTITDATGAVVAGAKIIITNKATGQVITQTSTGSGAYNSGGLLPGDYILRVEAKGFRTVWFGLVPLPNLVGRDAQLGIRLLELHETLNWMLITLVALHSAAALKHHFIDRDDVLVRMLPARTDR